MNRRLRIYGWLEAILGRERLCRLGRFLYFGARRELLNDPVCNGEYALHDWIIAGLQGAKSEGESEEPTIHFLDVGANLGEWTGALAQSIERHGLVGNTKIHAFEPAPAQGDAICSKFSSQVEDQAIVLCRKAVGASEGSVSFIVTGPQAGNNSIATENSPIEGETLSVPLTTVDDYAEEAKLDAIALLKVDTEGNDFNVIQGASRMLDEGRIGVLQFEYNWRWIDFGHWLKSAFDLAKAKSDYEFGLLTNDGIELQGEWHHEMERYIETNYVIVRRDLIDSLPCTWMRYDASNVSVPLQQGAR